MLIWSLVKVITNFFKLRCVRWFWWLLGPLAGPCKNWKTDAKHLLEGCHIRKWNLSPIQMLMSQLLNISETNFSTFRGLSDTLTTFVSLPFFQNNPDCIISSGTASRCSPPSPWPVPRLGDPGIGASAKPGHQITPAKHNMTSTVDACTMRKGRFFPTNKTAKAGWFSTEKQARTFFQWFFVALAARVLSFHLLVANGELANRWKNTGFLEAW